MTGGWVISCKIVLRWIPLDLTDDKSTLVQVIAWCRQATSHYLSQCWPRFMSPYGVTRPQWVKMCDSEHRLYRGMPQNTCDGKSRLVQEMAWCRHVYWHTSDQQWVSLFLVVLQLSLINIRLNMVYQQNFLKNATYLNTSAMFKCITVTKSLNVRCFRGRSFGHFISSERRSPHLGFRKKVEGMGLQLL